MRSRTDYITGTDRRLFLNVAVQDPGHNTDHYLVLACLPGVQGPYDLVGVFFTNIFYANIINGKVECNGTGYVFPYAWGVG